VEGDNTSLLEPVSKDGIEVDTIADNGSGSVTMNSALDLTDNQINYGTNAGSQTLADLPFGSSQRAGSVNSYTMQLDGDEVLTVGAQNDGSGNLSGAYVWAKKDLRLGGTLDARGGTIENTTGGMTVTTNDNGNLTLNPGANHKVQVFDGDASDSVDISHGGSAGEISTSTGHLKLNPFGNVELDGSDIISSDGFDIRTNKGDLKLDPLQGLTLNAGGPLTKPVEVTGGPFTRPTTSQSSDYDLGDNQEKYFVEVDTSSSNVTIHLPDSPSPGEEHVIKKSASANTLTIDADNEKIDGSTTIELTNQYASRKVIWGGNNWHITGEVAGQ